MFANLFWNNQEKRIRAGWRVLVQITLTVSLIFGPYYAGFFKGGRFFLARLEISLLVIALVVLWFSTRFLDKRRIRDLILNLLEFDWWADYGFGILLGVFQTVVFLLVSRELGWITFESVFQPTWMDVSLPVSVSLDVLTFLSVAMMEELIRAYQLRNIAEGIGNSRLNWKIGLLVGAIVASLFSMGMHLNQQGPSFWVYVFFGSLLYCLSFVLTGRVGIAMGLHFTWDFVITTVVALGGTTGASNAAVLFSAPLTFLGASRQTAYWMALLGSSLDVASVFLLIFYVCRRYGKVQLHRELTTYEI